MHYFCGRRGLPKTRMGDKTVFWVPTSEGGAPCPLAAPCEVQIPGRQVWEALWPGFLFPGGDGTGPSRAQEPCCNRADEDRPRQDLLRAYGELQRSGRVSSLPSTAQPMPIFYPTKPAEGRQDSARLMQKLSLRSGGTEPFSQLLSSPSVPAKMSTLDTPRKGRDGGSGQRLTHCLSSTWGKGPSSKAGSQTQDVGP